MFPFVESSSQVESVKRIFEQRSKSHLMYLLKELAQFLIILDDLAITIAWQIIAME
ncbi:MAG: hypothetical protein Kow0099_04010 [Candidatus Abyssubacteria bacterium]